MSVEDGQRLSDAAFAGDIPKLEGILATVPIDTADKDGFTALHRSCVTGNRSVIAFLLGRGAKVNLEDSYGDTPLHYACFCGHLEVAKLLVASGADKNKASRDGKTPIQSALEEGHTAVVLALGGTVPPAAVATGPAAPAAPGTSSGPGAYVAPAAPSAAFLVATSFGAAQLPGSAGGPPRTVGGLDFSKGIIIEGELKKKRANKMLKWRKKYYVLSRTYGALFFWTGSQNKVEGIIKKVRFETFLSVKHFPTKQGGKRLELRVVTGRSMQLLCDTAEEARRWVGVLKTVLGASMAVIRIQAVWRGHKARKALRKVHSERAKAVARVAGGPGGHGSAAAGAAKPLGSAQGLSPSSTAAAGAGAGRRSMSMRGGALTSAANAHTMHGAIKTAPSGLMERAGDLVSKATARIGGRKRGKRRGDGEDAALDVTVTLRADGVLIEGELKKKNSTAMSSLLSLYRTRYFVLYTPDVALYYFDSKAQRQLGTKPRAIPFLTFYAVFQVTEPVEGAGGDASTRGKGVARPSAAVSPGGGIGKAAVGAKTNRFKLRVVSGRVFEFEARSPAAAELWVAKLLSVLPRENAAAIKVQARFRAFAARKRYRAQRAQALDAARTLAHKYAKPPGAAVSAEGVASFTAAARRVKSYLRMRVARRAYVKALAARLAAEAAALGHAAAAAGGAVGISASASAAHAAKLRELRATRAGQAAGGGAAAAPAAPAAAVAAAPVSGWVKYADAGSGRSYWHNAATGETTWTDPDAPVYGEWRELTDAGSGRTYYHNTRSGEVVWELPAAAAAAKAALARAAKARWIRKHDEAQAGRVFFANVDSGETCWTVPPGMADGKARLLGHWFSKDAGPAPAAGGPAPRYFVHADSSTTCWERPDGYESDEDYSDRLLALADWVEVIDPASGRPYYFHRVTQERSWTNPWAAISLSKALPAAAGAAGPGPASPTAIVVDAVTPAPRQSVALRTASAAAAPRASAAGGVGAPRTATASVRRSTFGLPAAAAAAAPEEPAVRRSISARRPSSMRFGSIGAAASAAASADPASAWQSAVDPRTNRTYWFNAATGESSWERPEGMPAPAGGEEDAGGDANEAMTFTLFLNDSVQAGLAANPAEHGNDAVAARLPIDTDGAPPPLFAAARDGILLCRLVHALCPDAIDPRVVDYAAVPVEAAERERRRHAAAEGDAAAAAAADPSLDNCRLALSSAASAGAVFGRDVTAAGLAEGRPQCVLDFVWQCVKLASVNKVSLRGASGLGLARLSLEGESADDMLAAAPETLLMRWLNYQTGHAVPPCAAAGSIASFGAACLTDGTALCAAARAVVPAELTAEVPAGDAAVLAAGADAALTACLSAAFGAGVPPWFGVDGFKSGNMRLQIAFLAYLFLHAPGLPADGSAAGGPAGVGRARAGTGGSGGGKGGLTEEILAKLGAERALSAGGGGRDRSSEAASVAQWINSLDIEGIYVRTEGLMPALRDGSALLQILDAVQPGLVNWGRVNLRVGTNRYKQVENCNYVIDLGRAMDFHLVNVGGLDIVDGNAKLVLAYMWQVMRYATLQQLSKLAFDGFTADETEILRWANERVVEAATAAGSDGSLVRVSSFADPELRTGIYLLYLLSSVRAGVVDWALVADGETREQQVANAKYVLSVARRLGAQVFCTANDIVDVQQRPLMLFVASLMVAESRGRRGLPAAEDEGAVADEWAAGGAPETVAEEDEDAADADDSDDE